MSTDRRNPWAQGLLFVGLLMGTALMGQTVGFKAASSTAEEGGHHATRCTIRPHQPTNPGDGRAL
ncbi:MAG: hypothetical protein IIB42_09505 [Candidatus Marinimicrobia bacterium]|nr:hypothetical protein [Candidatus Neomarinimicrobiota bacterium]